MKTTLTVMVSLVLLWAAPAPATEEGAGLGEARAKLREALEQLRNVHEDWRRPFGGLPLASPEALVELDRPRLGVLIRNHADRDLDALGAQIEAVTPGGPADAAGLRAGDIITEIDGASLAGQVSPGMRLLDLVGDLEEGQEVTVEYLRDGRPGSAVVTARSLPIGRLLLDRPFGPGRSAGVSTFGLEGRKLFLWPEGTVRPYLGLFPDAWCDMELVAVNAELGAYFGVDRGVLVVRGPEDDGVDLRGGDILLDIDGREVRSPTHVMRILRSYSEGETASIRVLRHGRELMIDATAGGSPKLQEVLE